MRNGQTKGLLLFCLIFVKGCLASDDIIMSERVRARLGQSASLYCKVKDELHVTLFEWSRCNDSSFIAVLNPGQGSHIKEPYIGHVSISEYHNLTITQVQDRDFGEYCCKATTFPKGSLVGRVLLLKDEEKNEEVDKPRGPPAGNNNPMIQNIAHGPYRRFNVNLHNFS
ncbi:hypothetical protein PDJAM_G00163820 [Pangasius djambal]|uniref:Uncharacterized protein n=1 Tax=Pangasius djambal TaxID=1691987 RepID=A0ACC5ZKJ6_9TELE|nr:hypothetical protein [Pangasius djambal]